MGEGSVANALTACARRGAGVDRDPILPLQDVVDDHVDVALLEELLCKARVQRRHKRGHLCQRHHVGAVGQHEPHFTHELAVVAGDDAVRDGGDSLVAVARGRRVRAT